MNIVLLGAPGAGKGTQAGLLMREYRIPHISTGELFRSNIRENTPLGTLADEYISKGELVPDDVTIEMLAARLGREDCTAGFILDGFPRTIVQAEMLSGLRSIDYCINLEINEERVVERLSGRRICLKCGKIFHRSYYPYENCDVCEGGLTVRDDDKAETVLARLSVYRRSTAPLIEYYKDKGRLIEICADQDAEKVFLDIKKAIS